MCVVEVVHKGKVHKLSSHQKGRILDIGGEHLTLDQNEQGDWELRPPRYPNGHPEKKYK